MNILKQTKNRNKFYALALAMVMVIMSTMPAQAFAAIGDKANPTDAGLVKMYFGDPDYSPVPPESLMVFEETGTLTYDAVYTGINSATYYPDRLLLVVRPNSGTLTISNIIQTNVVATATSSTVGVYDVILGNVTQPKLEFDVTVGSTTQTITITFHKPKEDNTVGTGIYAFLPAPGQFTNEIFGGWGTIYTTSGLKNMVNNTVTTGISLGYFGGYVVFDMGLDGSGQGNVKNNPNHPSGYDFKVVGNAFSGNSEPGGIQVSKDGNTWYDIAGSFHYDDATKWDYKATYVDPVNGGSTGNTVVDRSYIPYYINGNTSNAAVVVTNTYHSHNWYPLAAHYITGMDKATGINRLPFAEYLYNQNALGYINTRTLSLSGVLLGGIVSNSTATGAFGYADVTSGGDNIDLDWAVNRTTGEPVNLDWIRYVRVYNAVAKNLPPFGEISTEVTGIYNITNTSGSGTTTATPTITVGTYSLQDLIDDGVATVTTVGNVNYYDATLYSSEYGDYDATVSASAPTGTALYVNSSKTGSVYVDFSTGAKFVRVVAMNGTLNPSIILIKLQ